MGTGVKNKGYKVVCISMYEDDLQTSNELVAHLRRQGYTKANRSWLIRMALKQFDPGKLTYEDNYR